MNALAGHHEVRYPLVVRAAVAAACAAIGVVLLLGLTSSPAGATVGASVANGTLTVSGTTGPDSITVRLQSGSQSILIVDVGNDGTADFSFSRATFTQVVLRGNDGDDTLRINESNGAFTDTEVTTLSGGPGNDLLFGGSGAETLDGGDGSDVINGGNGDDVLLGGNGNDTIDGGPGSDVAFGGVGVDAFVWDPGDGSDTFEGQAGVDTLRFNGSNVAENIGLSANGGRFRLSRDVALVVPLCVMLR